jgi:hypothetical protein
MAGSYRIRIPGFLGNTKPFYEATQDLMKNTWSELNNKKPLKSLKVYCVCPSSSNPKFR